MKKSIAAILVMAICLITAASIPVSAGSADQDSTETLGTDLVFEYKNDPTYTVSIPSTVEMTTDGAEMEITAENVAYLDNKKISVTIEGTDKYRNQMVLEGKSDSGRNASIRYQFVFEDGTTIETTGTKDEVVGRELASFTGDGTAKFTVRPIIEASSAIIKGVTYTGRITYGIELVDIA